jgi:hypothetical protein
VKSFSTKFFLKMIVEIIESYQHEDLIRISTQRKIELDVYLPNEQLAFEYQGEQHYVDIHVLGYLWVQKERDQEKKRVCKEKGITLIEIPYWWNFERTSLIATIHQHRPDLIALSSEEPIPCEPLNGIPAGNN